MGGGVKRRPARLPRPGSGDRPPLRLDDRLALRPAEVADVLGISERTVRDLLPELPVVRVGSCALVPVEGLRAWLRSHARIEGNRLDAMTEEILKDVRKS